MRRIRPLAFALCALATTPALAAPCAGFTDVDTANPNQAGFCPSVEWIRNRGVTTGCGGTLYCPDLPVTRLAMAAFMKRLGDALTPVDLPVVGSSGSAQAPGSGLVVCATTDFAVLNFPRRAYVNGSASISAPSASVDVRAEVVFSTNAGATWSAIGNSDQYATIYSAQTPPDQATLAPFGSVDLNVGQSVRFGVRLAQFAPAAPPNHTVTIACSTRAQIASRTGASSPLDAAPTAFVERPRGS